MGNISVKNEKKISTKNNKKTEKEKKNNEIKLTRKYVKKPSIKKEDKIKVIDDTIIKKTKVNRSQKEIIEKDKSLIRRLKREIRESEQLLTNEKNIRKIGTIIFLIFSFIVILLSICLIDYSNSSLKTIPPKFAIKVNDKTKQITKYYGLFYKAWSCDANGIINYSLYTSDIPHCELRIVYDENGIYTNPNNLKITKSQIDSLYRYYSESINYWKTQEELDNALFISNEFSSKLWVKKEEPIKTISGDEVYVAIFSKLTDNGWISQYSDESYYKCMKIVDEENILFSEYNSGNCETKWTKLVMSEKFCKIIKSDNSLIKTVVELNNLCKKE